MWHFRQGEPAAAVLYQSIRPLIDWILAIYREARENPLWADATGVKNETGNRGFASGGTVVETSLYF
jgi:hypothetical protein